MTKYDSENFDPPAPVALVSLRDPETGALLSAVPMLIDTGAYITLLPASQVEQSGMKATKVHPRDGLRVSLFYRQAC